VKLSLDPRGTNVLITGASSGIGRELARLIAPRARSLVLVARRIDRLEALRAELMQAHKNLQVRLEPCDLSDPDAAARLCDRLRDGDAVDVLVNNAGVGDFAPYDRADWGRVRALIDLNITSLALLTWRFVGGMVERGRGGILNISSGYGFAFSPGLAAYSGSKHFVTGFTESLRLDLVGTGVVVTQVCPGPVATEFDAVAGATGMVPKWIHISPEACARAALRGFLRGRAMVVPGFGMKLMRFLLAFTPRVVQRLVQAPFGRRFRRRLSA
jgi:short-subunit dehydrogenase